jgi:hypothetical protein
MLIRFVYLDTSTLAGYVAQLDGGLIAETKVRLVKKGSKGGHIDAKLLGAKAVSGNENEHFWTMSYPAEAQFQRLLAVAYEAPNEIAWIDVVDPRADFGSAQVGETIAWECDVDIAKFSRLAARGGGGARVVEMFGLFAQGGAAGMGLGGQTISAEEATRLKAQTEIAQQLLDSMNVNRVAVGRDTGTEWSVFGSLYADNLRVEDINNERLIVVGKVKRIVAAGDSRKLVNTEAMQLMQRINAPFGTAPDRDNELVGPALELDVLAIYR